MDGNKRLAWFATSVFRDLNRQPPELDQDAVFELVMKVAEGILELEQSADHLRLVDASSSQETRLLGLTLLAA